MTGAEQAGAARIHPGESDGTCGGRRRLHRFTYGEDAWPMPPRRAMPWAGSPNSKRSALLWRQCGGSAFVVVNGVIFASAHQVYSDPFILLILGSCMGFILAARG